VSPHRRELVRAEITPRFPFYLIVNTSIPLISSFLLVRSRRD
jgi:hypothetical protein